jgi:hypothetical protein
MIDITIVPGEVKRITGKVALWTQQIEADLNSGIVKDAAAYVPEGEAAREAVIALLHIALNGCAALIALSDSAGVKGRLQRVMADITAIQHDGNHHITHYIVWCEVVFNHLFGKSDN